MLPIFPEIKTIEKAEVEKYPLIAFTGCAEVVSDAQKMEDAVAILAQSKVLGFDTESKPAFKKGQRNGVALLQLSTQTNAFIFQIQKVGISTSLANLLSNPNIVKAGVAINDDIRKLRKIRDFVPQGFVELQHLTQSIGIENNSLKSIATLLLGYKISKTQRLSNWENQTLTNAQIQYATTDAWIGNCIYMQIQNYKNNIDNYKPIDFKPSEIK